MYPSADPCILSVVSLLITIEVWIMLQRQFAAYCGASPQQTLSLASKSATFRQKCADQKPPLQAATEAVGAANLAQLINILSSAEYRCFLLQRLEASANQETKFHRHAHVPSTPGKCLVALKSARLPWVSVKGYWVAPHVTGQWHCSTQGHRLQAAQ